METPNLPALRPECPHPGHGFMSLRTNPSSLAAWQGTWYDCRSCKSSELWSSPEHLAFLARERMMAEFRGADQVVDYSDDWKQVVVGLPSGPSGTCRFVTWERDATEAKYYHPEGLLLAKWPVSDGELMSAVLQNTKYATPAGFTVKFTTHIYGAED